MAYELVEEEKESQESVLSGVARGTARQASNLVTRAVGLPGDLFSLVNEYIANPVVEAFGGPNVPYEETILGKLIPTTETHRSGVEASIGDYLKPRDEVERFIDDVIEDTALLMVPGGKAAKVQGVRKLTQHPLPRNFVKSLGANVAGKTATDISGDESTGDLVKLGSLFFLSLLDTPAAAKKISEMYGVAEKALPEGARTSATRLSKSTESLKNKITKGRPLENLAPTERFVVNEIEKIENLVKDGYISVEQAWAQKRSLNENLQKHLYDNPKDSKRAKNLAKPLTHFLNQTLEEYGKTNPKFGESFKSAEEGFRVIAQSNFISNWVEKNISSTPAISKVLHLFSSGAETVGTAILPYHVTKIGYRIAKSPTLRKLYEEAIVSATKQDIPGFIKILSKMNEELGNEENEDKYEFID